MTKFKVGDRVCMVEDIFSLKKGDAGTVKGISDPDAGKYAMIKVEFDRFPGRTKGLYAARLVPAIPEFQPGDKVKLDHDNCPSSKLGLPGVVVETHEDPHGEQLVTIAWDSSDTRSENLTDDTYPARYFKPLVLGSPEARAMDFKPSGEPKTNDGQTVCRWCGGELRTVDTGFDSGRVMQVCTLCER